MSIQMKIGDIVFVKWLDSYGTLSGWMHLDDFKPSVLEITSIGKVIYEDDVIVSLAHNFADETDYTASQVNGIMTIPKACIQEVISCPLTSCREPESAQKLQPS